MRKITLDNRLFFYIIFVGVLVVTYQVVKPLLTIIALALILSLTFQPVYKGILKIVRKKAFATPLTLLTILLTFIIPIVFISVISINQLKIFINDIGDFAGVETGLEEEVSDETQTDPELEGRVQIKTGDDMESEDGFEIDVTDESDISKSSLNTIANNLNQLLDSLSEDNDLEFVVEEKSEGENVVSGSTKFGNVDVDQVIDDANELLARIPFVEVELTLEQVQDTAGQIAVAAGGFIGDQILATVSAVPVFIMNLIVFIILLSTFLPSMQKLKSYVMSISPLDNEIDNLYIKKLSAMTISMVQGTFIISIIQGIIIGILLLIAGVEYVVFWAILCMFLSLIPNGAAVVNWPIAIILIATGNVFGGVVVILGNLIIVGNIENIIRPLLVSKEAQIHPALILIGLIGGLQTFGFLGVIYGPVILILLVTSFEVYKEHYKNYEIEAVN